MDNAIDLIVPSYIELMCTDGNINNLKNNNIFLRFYFYDEIGANSPRFINIPCVRSDYTESLGFKFVSSFELTEFFKKYKLKKLN